MIAQSVVQTDATPVTVAQDAEGKTVAGRVWVCAYHEGRICNDFTASRKRDGPQRVLGNCKGYLQADAYGGYDQLFVPNGATEVACWAPHAASSSMRSLRTRSSRRKRSI